MTKTIKALAAAGITGLLSAGASAAPIQWTSVSGGNDHWYEFVATPVTAQTAFSQAALASYLGMQGYLVTVTSAAENTFVSSTVAGGQLAWLGGSDAGAGVNQWTWRSGPENGQAFTFTSWGGGEPNNCCGGEDYLHTNWGGLGLWNDHGGPANSGQVNGYVIEYSAAAPEPATLGMLLTALGVLGLRRKQHA